MEEAIVISDAPRRTRLQQLVEMIPDIWNYKTILYIGAKVVEKSKARWGGMRFLSDFSMAGYAIDILEIWPKNIQKLKEFNQEKRFFRNIMEGDVRDIKKYIKQKYDIVMWYHGPEHIKELEIASILKKLEFYAEKLVITACPWGIYEQGSISKNYHETHKSYLYPGFFESLGWKIDIIGTKDISGSNLLAWKRIK